MSKRSATGFSDLPRTALIFYTLTGKASLSLGAGALDMVLKIGVYFVHERIWNHINFGRSTKAPEYEI